MSLERALEENTAALREFTVYVKLALDAAAVVNAKQQTQVWDDKAKLDREAMDKQLEESRAAMRAELAEARDRVAGPLVEKPREPMDVALRSKFKAEDDVKAADGAIAAAQQEIDARDAQFVQDVEKGKFDTRPAIETKKPVAEAPPKVTAAALLVTETASALTLADISLGITAAAKVDRARVVAVLASFGVKTGGALKPEQFADFLDALK